MFSKVGAFTENYCALVIESAEIFQSLPLGRVLKNCSSKNQKEVFQAIIKDFVYMVHPVKSYTECQVTCLNFDYYFINVPDHNIFGPYAYGLDRMGMMGIFSYGPTVRVCIWSGL